MKNYAVIFFALALFDQSQLIDTIDPAHLPTVSYHWDFGDQTTSTQTSPTHRYTLPGTYTVTLVTYLNGQPSDTLSQTLRIIMGLREFKIDNYTYAINADEAAQKGSLVLYASSPDGNNKTFGLLGLDSLLHVKWTKPISGDNSTIRLSSMKRVNANAYILSGNYSSGNTNAFCLSEIDSTGNLIWMKYLDTLNGTNTYTLPLSAGGFLTTGTVAISNRYYSAVVKCDANGNEIWKKIFDSAQSLVGISNIVETAGGYAFASLSTAFSPQIVLTELDLNGNITNQQSTSPYYAISAGGAGLLYNSHTFLVYTTTSGAASNYFYLFDNNLSYTGAKYLTADLGVVKGGFNDKSYFAIWTSANQYALLSQIMLDGSPGWNFTLDPSIYTSCSSTFIGADRNCEEAVYTGSNEIIVLADGQNSNNTQSVYLSKLTSDGQIK